MKYKHKLTGQIVTKGTDGLFHSKEGGYTLQRWIFENSNDWEEVLVENTFSRDVFEQPKEEPNYLITAFRFKDSGDIWDLKSDGSYGANPIISKYTLKEMLKGYVSVLDNSFEIYSVKNSKGEEFTIGDVINTENDSFKIELFELNKSVSGCCARGKGKNINGADINFLSKVRETLYTTTDGVDIYEGDRVWLSLLNGDLKIETSTTVLVGNFSKQDKEVADRYLTFTSEENRDKYIKENTKKPVLVAADGKEIFEGDTIYHFYKPFEYMMHKSIARHNTIYGDIIFYAEEKAKEYIDNNKPKFSLKEIESCYPSPTYSPLFTTFIANLKKLGK